mgnify:FL=1
MKNKLIDLNNHLFEQMERLNDEDLSEENFKKEIERAKAMTGIAQNIIQNGKLMLDSMKFVDETGYGSGEVTINPKTLIGGGGNE